MSFKVGQSIVCVDDSVGEVSGKKTLTKDKVYKVLNLNNFWVGEVFVNDGSGMSWPSCRFKPLELELDYNFV